MDGHQQLFPNSRVDGNYSELIWSPCDEAEGIDCTDISVPKDYFDASVGRASVAVARIKATTVPKKGTVFVNPGGPGGSGVEFVQRRGPYIAKMVGMDFDIVGFDPRGIAGTKPTVECFADAHAAELFKANTVLVNGNTLSTIRNVSSDLWREELVSQQVDFLALKETQAILCGEHMGDDLKCMGTATVVRDIDYMAQLLDGRDAPIHYWGGSYGSILGNYLVNMLPDRVGYVAINGIASSISWSGDPSHKWPQSFLNSTEETYKLFLNDCSEAGPELCPLARYKGESWRNIEERLEDLFDDMAAKPLRVPHGAFRPGYLTSGAARGLLLIFLERPLRWPEAAVMFSQALEGNGTLLFNTLSDTGIPYGATRLAVTCLDSPPPRSVEEFPTAEELADELIKTMEETSIHFGMSVGVGEPDGGCQFWPAKGPERFTDPWNATLKTPMLILSNTLDPVTPMTNAIEINNLMPESSVIVIQNGPGHCSTALPSLCTMKHSRDYFAGIVPKNGTWCEVDVATFPGPEDGKSLLSETMSVDDLELLEAARQIGLYFAEL